MALNDWLEEAGVAIDAFLEKVVASDEGAPANKPDATEPSAATTNTDDVALKFVQLFVQHKVFVCCHGYCFSSSSFLRQKSRWSWKVVVKSSNQQFESLMMCWALVAIRFELELEQLQRFKVAICSCVRFFLILFNRRVKLSVCLLEDLRRNALRIRVLLLCCCRLIENFLFCFFLSNSLGLQMALCVFERLFGCVCSSSS